MLMCCLVGAFSRPKTDLVRRRYTYLHIQYNIHKCTRIEVHIQLTHALQLAYASAAALSARAGADAA